MISSIVAEKNNDDTEFETIHKHNQMLSLRANCCKLNRETDVTEATIFSLTTNNTQINRYELRYVHVELVLR